MENNLQTAPALWLPTYSGMRVNLLDPDPATIKLIDIAQALSKLPRYLGHTIRTLSVAEHSVRLALVCPMELRPEALLHDAPEAFLADIPMTYKRSSMMGDYLKIEAKLAQVINWKFHILQTDPQVQHLDKVMRLAEWDSGLFRVPESLIGYSTRTSAQIAECKTLQRAMKCYPVCDRWGWHPTEALEQFLGLARRLGLE